jgi:hypothetical protein
MLATTLRSDAHCHRRLSKGVAAMVKTATPRYGRQHWGALKAVS